MEYLGSLLSEKCRSTTHIMWPIDWSCTDDKYGFIFVQEEQYIKIYPRLTWKAIMGAIVGEKEKIAWSEKSSIVQYVNTQSLSLPFEGNWKKIDYIGMVEYIIIRECTE